MFLNRKDLDKINAVLSQFPLVDVFQIEQDNSNGIGSTTTIKFDYEVNQVRGVFLTELSGVEDW